MNVGSRSWPEILAPALLFLLAFAFALSGLNPTFFVDDSPETVTACAAFGIPHPPGYPLHTLVGHLFSQLPLAHFPFRVNLLSAVLGSCLCAGLYGLMTKRFEVPPVLAAPLSLFWIVGTTAYPAALSAKTGIYEWTGIFLLAILGALLSGKIPLAFFLYGLSLTNHWMSMVFFLPGFAVLAARAWGRPGAPPAVEGTEEGPRVPWHRFLPSGRPVVTLTLMFLGLSVYWVLPLRAHLGPSLNWGEPSTLEGFLQGFLRSQYTPGEGRGTAADGWGQFASYLGTAFREFPWLLPLILLGFLKGGSPAFPAKGLLAVWALLIGAICLYLNLPKGQYFLIADYSLPAHLFLLLFAGAGSKVLWAFLEEGGRRVLRLALAGLLTLGLLWQGSQVQPQKTQMNYTFVHDLCLNGFKAVPSGSLYFVRADSLVFSSWYFQWVEGKRKDLCVVGVDGLPMDWVRKGLTLAHPSMKFPVTRERLGPEAVPALMQWILDKNPSVPLWLSYASLQEGTLPGMKTLPCGVSSKVLRKGEEPALEEGGGMGVWEGLRLRHVKDGTSPIDRRTRDWVVREYAVFRNHLGLLHEEKGDALRAKFTPRSRPEDLLSASSHYERSHRHFLWAAQWSPEVPEHPFNVGNALFNQGRITESIPWYEKAVVLKPDYLDAHFNEGVAAFQSGQYRKARDCFEKVLSLDPAHAQARHGADYISQQGLAVKEDQHRSHTH